MSFSGKKFRRVRSEHMDELLKASKVSEHIINTLVNHAPIFSFTRIDDNTFNFTLQTDSRVMSRDIKLGEETVMERRDGSKVTVIYTLESDNVLQQVNIPKDGKVSYFKREFGDREAKMTITTEGTDIEAYVYYEVVD